jgi:hypothetical protein
MFKKLILSTVAASTALTVMPAAAQAQGRNGYYGHNGYDHSYRNNRNGRYETRYQARRYNNARYGNYYGQRCRSDGTAGTIIGAIAGGLLGSSVAGRGDRTVGALIGGGAGALIGNAIASDNNCRR